MTKRTLTAPFAISLASISILAVALGACGGPINWDPPLPDSCSLPSGSSVTSLEVGSANLNGLRLWDERDTASLDVGVQGGIMLPFKVKAAGTNDTCLPMQVRVEYVEGGLITDLSYPMQLYPQGDGTLVSDRHYIIFDSVPWGEVFLEVTVADTTAAYTLELID